MLLDTDTISYYLRGDEQIKQKLHKYHQQLSSTVINYAELIYGLKKQDNKKYLPKVLLIFDNIRLYDFIKKSADIFAGLKSKMSKVGIIMADMDLMIASIAIANDEILITNNIKYFSKIDDLIIKSWV